MPPNRSAQKPLSPPVPGNRPLPQAVWPSAGQAQADERPGGRAAALAGLRRRIARIERGGAGRGQPGLAPLTTGVAALDAALPGGGLARAALHEVLAAEADGAAAAFTALLAARRAALAGGTVLWCTAQRTLYGPGLAAFGLTPQRLLLAWGRRDEDRLWAMEEGLRCPRLAAVVGEVWRLDLKQSRRLQLAAAGSGVTALLLRPPAVDGAAGASAAVTRWRVESAPSAATAGYAGVGAARFRLALQRARGGRPGDWDVEWNGRGLSLVTGHGNGNGKTETAGEGGQRGTGAGTAPVHGAVAALVADGAA